MIRIRFLKQARDTSRNLRNLERVGQAGTVEIAVAKFEELGLAQKPLERRGTNDARIINVSIFARVLALWCPPLATGLPFPGDNHCLADHGYSDTGGIGDGPPLLVCS